MEKDVCGFNKEDSSTIAKSMLGCEVSHEHDDHAILYVEVMWKELVEEFREKSCDISRITSILWKNSSLFFCT